MSLIRAFESTSIIEHRRHPHRHALSFTGVIVILSFFFFSCNSKKYLTENQSFLYANKTTIKSDYKVDNKSGLYDALQTLYRQPETKTVIGIPRHTFYYKYIERKKRKPDSKDWSDERIIKNRPVIFDSLKAQQTTEDFDRYLALRGYRYAESTFKTKTSDKQTIVNYHVNPGPRLYIDTFLIIANDFALQRLVDSVPNPGILIAGKPLDIDLYNQERSRIVRLIQNEGYATFDESYIPQLEVDTSMHRVKAIMRILNPTDSTYHIKYYNGNITVYPDYDAKLSKTFYDTIINGVTYKLPDSLYFTLKPDVIERNLYLHKGLLNRKSDLERTVRGLYRIDLISFVDFPAIIDTSDKELPKIHYVFYLGRNKKIDLGANAELTYANIATVKKSLFGVAFSLNHRDLNTFKGGEVLNLNLESGFEFNFVKPDGDAKRDIINSVNLGAGANLSFPRFMDPLRLYHMIGYHKDPDKKAPIGNQLAKWLNEEAVSRVNLGANYVDIQDLYKYTNINSNLSYVMQPDPSRKLTIDRLGFDLFIPVADTLYQKVLDSNKFLNESFGKELFTGFLFRDYLFELNTKLSTKKANKPTHFEIFHNAEISGLEVFGINLLANTIEGETKAFGIPTGQGADRDTISFSQFVRGELDVRYFNDIGRNSVVAFRFNTGLAFPYGPYTSQVPYVKQFFVGGALSNRAWDIRELGPGSSITPPPDDPNTPFYQTGDVKIDMSLELRFKLLWYFYSAVFIDAANVWALNRGKDDPANFELNRFYKELGIGYGYGLRIDLNYFIVRMDVGYKFYNPYPVNGSHVLTDELKKFPGGGQFQLAVGQKF
jgi:outer membrane protein insertion porin family